MFTSLYGMVTVIRFTRGYRGKVHAILSTVIIQTLVLTKKKINFFELGKTVERLVQKSKKRKINNGVFH